MSDRLSQLSQSGVSIWLDDLSRARLNSGDLARKIREDDVVGVTTNPAIFQAAISGAADYAAPIAELASSGASPEEVIKRLTTDDVREACDLFHDVYERTGGYDGRVSIEVDPRLARRTAETLEQAGELWATVDRPNVMIKIPATVEGLPAITDAIAAGISVNATLIFSVERYVEVAQAYLAGLEKARRAGLDLSGIHSVASFFVSRVDGEVDRLLGELGRAELAGRAAVANARIAYGAFLDIGGVDGLLHITEGGRRFADLAEAGANLQRPLWASTGVKNPAYRDTMYVDELVSRHVVNTMPEKTLLAVADHGDLRGDTIRPAVDDARSLLGELAAAGVDLADVTSRLEYDGVAKFEIAWADLIRAVTEQLHDH